VPAALAESIAPEVDARVRVRVETVSSVVFARAVVVDARHALLTFAATMTSGARYVTVPVARDDRDGLVVDELPSFAVPPRIAHAVVDPAESVSGVERDELAAIVERFLRAYVAGDAGALAYLVPAGNGSRPRPGCCPHPRAALRLGVCCGGLGVPEALPAQPAYLAHLRSRPVAVNRQPVRAERSEPRSGALDSREPAELRHRRSTARSGTSGCTRRELH
jgi:hypothetical protein